MFLFVDYQPNIVKNESGEEISNSKLVVGTPIGGADDKLGLQMAKLNTFNGDQADLMYGMLVGVNEKGEIKDVEKETVNE
jgi:hypothetical protein